MPIGNNVFYYMTVGAATNYISCNGRLVIFFNLYFLLCVFVDIIIGPFGADFYSIS